MLHKYLCRPKETIECFYITRDNVEEFVNKYGNKTEYTIVFDERFASVQYSSCTWYIKLNSFMVRDDYPFWNSYTEEEFEEEYELISRT